MKRVGIEADLFQWQKKLYELIKYNTKNITYIYDLYGNTGKTYFMNFIASLQDDKYLCLNTYDILSHHNMKWLSHKMSINTEILLINCTNNEISKTENVPEKCLNELSKFLQRPYKIVLFTNNVSIIDERAVKYIDFYYIKNKHDDLKTFDYNNIIILATELNNKYRKYSYMDLIEKLHEYSYRNDNMEKSEICKWLSYCVAINTYFKELIQ
jgi:hypothetical protein